MQTGRDFTKIIEAARTHYANLKTDIENAKDRVEHIRLTALANEAHRLLKDLEIFELGLVYSHTAAVPGITVAASTTSDETLDLPEFKSPFDPRHHV